jgi:hypothetical protein
MDADRRKYGRHLFAVIVRGSFSMVYSPLTLARRHVLGNLYERCDRIDSSVTVYLNDADGEQLGFVDESMGKYADAFTFHLAEEICKRLAGGQFIYSFDYRVAAKSNQSPKQRIKLTSIFLTMRKGYDKPVARAAAAAHVVEETADAK